jgi:hypothetical protein
MRDLFLKTSDWTIHLARLLFHTDVLRHPQGGVCFVHCLRKAALLCFRLCGDCVDQLLSKNRRIVNIETIAVG